MGGAKSFDAVVVGGGIVGLWAALDLGLRGAKVLLAEKAWLGSGTSSRFHGLLHSGGRYAVRDPVSARECVEENRVLRRVMPHAVEPTGGYFVALTAEEERFYETWAEAARKAGIPFSEVPPGEARREEPSLNPAARLVVEVPDGVIYARESHASLALTAWLDAGALIAPGLEAAGFEKTRDGIAVTLRDTLGGKVLRVEARVVVNAAGPWAPRVAELAGLSLDMNPVAGTIVAYPRPGIYRVLNRLRPPSDGDILVPYGPWLLAGTTAYRVDTPTAEPRPGDVELLAREAAALAPRLRGLEPVSVFASVRPLAARGGGREASRSFLVIAHPELPGFISVTGGKYTTARLVAEHVGEKAAELLGLPRGPVTREHGLRGGDPLGELRELAPAAARLLGEAGVGMEEARARPAAYLALEAIVAGESRRRLGLGGYPVPGVVPGGQ